MVSMDLPVGITIVIPIKYWCFGGYVKVRKSLYTRVIIWVNTIPNHIDTRVILPRYESSCMGYRPEWYWKPNDSQILISYCDQTTWNPHYRYPNGIKKEDNANPTLVHSYAIIPPLHLRALLCSTKCHTTPSLHAIQWVQDDQYGSMMTSVSHTCYKYKFIWRAYVVEFL